MRRHHLNLTYLLLAIAASLIALFVFVTGVPSLPALFKIFRAEQLSSSPPVTQRVPAPSRVPADPITFVAFLTGALDKTLTDIQQEEFINAHDGRRVTWEGYVIGVTREHFPLNPSRAFNFAFRPEAEKSGPLHWNFAMAWFPDAAKRDLLTLHEGQHVVVSGILATGTNPGHPILNDARLEKIYP